MTKRHCYLTDVGDAIEKLADALDPERAKPFSGDILDLLEWAAKDVLAMRAEIERLKTVPMKYRRMAFNAQLQVENAQLSQQVTLLRDAINKFLSDNDPEGFGCACSPNFICGPCSEAKRQRPLYEVVAATEPKTTKWEHDIALFTSNQNQQLADMQETLKDHGEIQSSLCQQLADSQAQVTLLRDALMVGEEFINRHTESWYISGQRDLETVRKALAATKEN